MLEQISLSSYEKFLFLTACFSNSFYKIFIFHVWNIRLILFDWFGKWMEFYIPCD